VAADVAATGGPQTGWQWGANAAPVT
jgi:hypothetical protein